MHGQQQEGGRRRDEGERGGMEGQVAFVQEEGRADSGERRWWGARRETEQTEGRRRERKEGGVVGGAGALPS